MSPNESAPPPPSSAREHKIISDDGLFHAPEEEVNLSDTIPEAWIALCFFWGLGLVVFYQFFTRYVLNNSAAWTEELGRYLLVATVFTGAVIGVAKNNHIQVDFFYRHLPRIISRPLSVITDLLRSVFFGFATYLTFQLMVAMKDYRMAVIDWSMNWVYGTCLLGFLLMFLRSLWVAYRHWQQGYSVLERPESGL